ncbi:MAG: hypothetical protein ACOYL6_05120 [Bacteriovoracaceae bacterium]
MTKSKAFFEAMNLVNDSWPKAKNFLNDKRLNQTEKQIILAFNNLRENSFEEIIGSLSKIKADDPFVETYRKMVLGLAFNNRGEPSLALPYFISAWEDIKDTSYIHAQFYSLYNLFIAYRNLKSSDLMGETLELMAEINLEKRATLQIMRLRCRFFYLSFTKDLNKAEDILVQIEQVKDQLNESQALSHHIDKFDFFVKMENYPACYKTLSEFKQFRVYVPSANFKFMKILLDNIVDHRPVYSYDKDFKNSPLLYYQLNVVKCLEEGRIEDAKVFWQELSNMSPTIYQNDLIYKGDKCLFSIAFEKQLKTIFTPDKNLLPKDKSKEQTLLRIMQEASGPLRKEQIYFLVWNEKLIDKNDLMKLSQLVTRVKKKFNVTIKTRKGCYYLEQQPLKKVS